MVTQEHWAIEGRNLVRSATLEEFKENPAFVKALNDDRRAAVQGFVRAMFARPQPEGYVERLTRAALRMRLEDSMALFPKHLAREHWRGITARFTRPLLYIVTERLREQGENMKRERPATRLEVFEKAGHAIFLDEPERFNVLLEAFAADALAKAA